MSNVWGRVFGYGVLSIVGAIGLVELVGRRDVRRERAKDVAGGCALRLQSPARAGSVNAHVRLATAAGSRGAAARGQRENIHPSAGVRAWGAAAL